MEYCFLGFVPGVRHSIKFSYRNTFGKLQENVEKYHNDFAIGNMEGAPPVWKIMKELASPSADSGKTSPDLTMSLFKAMLQGEPFPEKLLSTVVRRIKTDHDEEKKYNVKFNDTRVGLVKACLNRKIKNEKEKITMALNKENKSPAYQCGRLFAVLEAIQKSSVEGKLNKTIADTYFSSAVSTPALILPKLVVLSQSHMAKLNEGQKIYYSKLCGEIVDNIADEFPKTLTLEEQGMFIIGYYHQTKVLYTKKENKEEE